MELFISRRILSAFLLFFAIFLYITSANNNIGWFAFISAFIIGFLVVSFIVSKTNISFLKIKRHFRQTCSKGDTITVNAEITNTSPIPSFLVLIRDAIGKYTKNKLPGGPFIPFIKGNSSINIPYSFTMQKRGVFKVEELQLQSYFPFGLFFSAKKIKKDSEITVLPLVPYIKTVPCFYNSERNTDTGLVKDNRFRQNSDFCGLREHVAADGMRLVDWKKTATTGKLMVKLFESKSNSGFVVYIDESIYGTIGTEDENPFEYMLSLAAGLGNYASKNTMKIEIIEKLPDGNAVIKNYNYRTYLQKLAEKTCANTPPGDNYDFGEIKSQLKVLFTADPFTYNALSGLTRENPELIIIFIDASGFGKFKRKKDKQEYIARTNELINSSLRVYLVRKGDDLGAVFSPKTS